MAKVTFTRDGRTFDVTCGERLLDLCRRENVDVLFGCESGVCGTCLSRVSHGAENLSKPSEEEQEMLKLFSQDPHERLVCQCRLVKDKDVTID